MSEEDVSWSRTRPRGGSRGCVTARVACGVVPRGLFLTKEPLRTHELKDALKDHPILKPDNVVLHCFRSIYRQAPKADVFLL